MIPRKLRGGLQERILESADCAFLQMAFTISDFIEFDCIFFLIYFLKSNWVHQQRFHRIDYYFFNLLIKIEFLSLNNNYNKKVKTHTNKNMIEEEAPGRNLKPYCWWWWLWRRRFPRGEGGRALGWGEVRNVRPK